MENMYIYCCRSSAALEAFLGVFLCKSQVAIHRASLLYQHCQGLILHEASDRADITSIHRHIARVIIRCSFASIASKAALNFRHKEHTSGTSQCADLALKLMPTLNLFLERPGTACIADHRVPPKLMNGVTHPRHFDRDAAAQVPLCVSSHCPAHPLASSLLAARV
jgi:hypothetical protein